MLQVHRDIKPANVLLMSNERETVAKLSDFGVAKYMYASSRYLNTTIAGTQQFMAPEVQLQTGHSTNADVCSSFSFEFSVVSQKKTSD